MAQLANVREPLDRFQALFGEHMSSDDHIDFYANHHTEEGDTFLRLETRVAPNVARLVLEEYVVRGKMHGTVITAYPTADSELPVFFCQIGGIGDRSIAVLDISPTTPDLDLSPLEPVHAKYSELLGLEPTKSHWLQSICSPYLLHCNYAELDTDLYVEAMVEYCRVWIEHYYEKAPPAATDRRRALVENAIYKFKYQLHHHDPAYGIFAKSWGKPVADAFVFLECGDHPAYAPPEVLDSELKPWHDDERNVLWTSKAQEAVLESPDTDHAAVRAAVERAALADGMGIITPELLQAYRT